MMSCCYALDLYCDNESDKHDFQEFPHQFIHEYGSACRTTAKRAGWLFTKDGRHLCPKCSGKKPKAKTK